MNQTMRSQAGYSLAEMLTVVAIIGVLSLVMVPNFIGYYQSNKMKTSMRNLTSDLRTCRQLAITQGKQAALVYGTGTTQRGYNYYLGDKSYGSTVWTPQTGPGTVRPTRMLDNIAYFPAASGTAAQSFPKNLVNCNNPNGTAAPLCESGAGLPGTSGSGTDAMIDIVFYPDGRVLLPANTANGAITIMTDLSKVPIPEYAIAITPSGRAEALKEVTFAALGSPLNGSVLYCADCKSGTPCAGAGTGALAQGNSSQWACN